MQASPPVTVPVPTTVHSITEVLLARLLGDDNGGDVGWGADGARGGSSSSENSSSGDDEGRSDAMDMEVFWEGEGGGEGDRGSGTSEDESASFHSTWEEEGGGGGEGGGDLRQDSVDDEGVHSVGERMC